MRVFIGGVMQGSNPDRRIADQGYRRRIADALEARCPGVEVIDPLDLHPASIDYDDEKAKRTLFAMVDLAAASDLVIAFVPAASMGTALEMWAAHRAGVPVLTISPLALNWVVRSLSRRVFPDIESFLAHLGSAESPGALV